MEERRARTLLHERLDYQAIVDQWQSEFGEIYFVLEMLKIFNRVSKILEVGSS